MSCHFVVAMMSVYSVIYIYYIYYCNCAFLIYIYSIIKNTITVLYVVLYITLG